MEMLFDLVENRISDPELHQPSGKCEFDRLAAALHELKTIAAAATLPSVQRKHRGRPPKGVVLRLVAVDGMSV